LSVAARSRSRLGALRRAVVGAAWAAAWMGAWASALLVFSAKTHAAAPAASPSSLTLAVSDGTVSLPIYVAQARGFFADEGLSLRVEPCRSGRECFALMQDGRADVATAAELVVATAGPVKRDPAILATISASSHQIKIVARRGAALAEAPQMAGKRVGTVAGSSAQFFLDNWLIYNDIDPRAVTVVPETPAHIVDALAARDVDAIAIWEPLASGAAARLGGEGLVFANARVYTQHFNLVADRAQLGLRGAAFGALLRALLRAQDAIAADPAAALGVLAKRLGVPPAVAASAMADQDFRVRLDQSLVTTMQSQARWARRSGLVHGGAPAVDLLRAIEPGPLRAVAPQAVGLVQ
jgi:ABC-type nitrate/sulfonate/bicarbonate transport system substrate-binding protein